jgi:hypothetical protein
MLGIYGPMVSRLQDVFQDIPNSRTGELLEFRLVMRICGVVCILTRLHTERSVVCFSTGTSDFFGPNNFFVIMIKLMVF